MSDKIEVRKLSLKKGDILIVERGFNIPTDWLKILGESAKESGIDFNVPVVFVDNIRDVAVLRKVQAK